MTNAKDYMNQYFSVEYHYNGLLHGLIYTILYVIFILYGKISDIIYIIYNVGINFVNPHQ